MDHRAALQWEPPPDWITLAVIDAHTGGEPFRVVIEGLPHIPGDTVLERRRHATHHLDHLRRASMWEPRGHADMYGGWIGSPVSADADLSVLFTHNDGFSTMCGHGIIALAKVVLETGIIPARTPETVLAIDTPAGLIQSTSRFEDGRVTSTRFSNVPSFAADLDSVVEVPGLGQVRYDLAFGGAFYALIEAGDVGVGLDDVRALVDTGRVIKDAISSSREVAHPDSPELGFLYGVIFTGEAVDPGSHSRNVCVFADGELDRSPTGTGLSARLAAMHERGEIGVGESIRIESIVGSRFSGRVLETTRVGGLGAVIPEVEGSAHITGRAELWIDPADDLGSGFLIR